MTFLKKMDFLAFFVTALRHDPISQNRRTFALSIYKLGGVYPEP